MIARRLMAALRLAVSPVLAAAALALLAVPAQAETPIAAYDATPGNVQAGGHPDVEIYFEVENRVLQHSQSACNCEDVKDATVHFPAGFIGNPHATPQCTVAQFSANECPIDSQVGIVNVFATNGASFNSALYNLIPPPDVAGLLGFKIYFLGTPQFTVLSARTGGDYGLDAAAVSIYHGSFPLQNYQQDIWGVPADPIHDRLRLNPEQNPQGKGETAYGDTLCDASGAESSIIDPNTIVRPCIQPIPPAASHSPLIPFLQDPTNCDSVSSSTFEVLSYDGGVTHAADVWPQMTGCSQLAFNPSLYAQPTTAETDSASGIEVNLNVPQELSPTIPSPTELRGAAVTLPEGFSINPNAADGKTACSDAAANFGTTQAANCPEFSKIGSLTIDSSALPGPLPGFVYLGEPLPGNRYRIFLVADGFATHIKLAGTVTPDPLTGQLKISFNELPQSPLTAFNLHIFGSERGLLATPTRCGTYPVTSTFTPWDSSLGPETSPQYFTLASGPYGAPCPGPSQPFHPRFQAASANHTPGAHAPFSLELIRPDGDQNLSGLTVKTPPGFSATLAGIPYCSEAALAHAATGYSGLAELENPSCPVASQIGTAVTGSGAGTHPLYVPGKVYLAGPYRGAPLSLAVVTPAVSGPYDLGNVVVRAALHIDPTDAHITAVSDPLPHILEGIPLRLRSVRINLDRPNFAINPTNCDPFTVNASLTGDQGAVASLSEHFQVANCASLSFAPKLALSFTGGTKRTQNPAIHALLTAKPGEARIASTAVTLPPTELVDNAHIGNLCTRVQFAEGSTPGERCPPGSRIGFARAVTPLLEKPIEGPVYLRSNGGERKLPDVVAALNGQIDIALDGHLDTVHGGLRTTFETVPDAPVTKFTLRLDGGNKGLLENSKNLCKAPRRVVEKIGGQNGMRADQNPVLQTPCGLRHKRHSSRTRVVR
jgi:hypothetical protein